MQRHIWQRVRDALLDLLSMNEGEWDRDMKGKRSLNCSNHETVKLNIPGEVSKKISDPGLTRADFSLFRDLPVQIPWQTAL